MGGRLHIQRSSLPLFWNHPGIPGNGDAGAASSATVAPELRPPVVAGFESDGRGQPALYGTLFPAQVRSPLRLCPSLPRLHPPLPEIS